MPDDSKEQLKYNLEDTQQSYLERFQTMAGQIAQVQSNDPTGTKRALDRLPEESAAIIKNYQKNLSKENALIISSKNRFEVNE